MYDMQKWAEAQNGVYVVSNADGSDAEFVRFGFDAATAESTWQGLRARWAGRNLKGVGVAGVIRGIPTVMLKEEPSDFLQLVRLSAAFAHYVDALAQDGPEPQHDCFGDTVAWCERLYALPDTRTN